MKPLHITNPHGAQIVSHAEPLYMRKGQEPRHQLFSIKEPRDKGEVVMTGEELDSLCAWWASYRGK